MHIEKLKHDDSILSPDPQINETSLIGYVEKYVPLYMNVIDIKFLKTLRYACHVFPDRPFTHEFMIMITNPINKQHGVIQIAL